MWFLLEEKHWDLAINTGMSPTTGGGQITKKGSRVLCMDFYSI
jgi:hypothetical protein